MCVANCLSLKLSSCVSERFNHFVGLDITLCFVIFLVLHHCYRLSHYLSSASASTSLSVFRSVSLSNTAFVSASFSSSASARAAPNASAIVSVCTPACSVSRHPQCPVCRSFPWPPHRRVF